MGLGVRTEAGLESRNAINGGREGKEKSLEEKETVVGVDGDVGVGESVCVMCVHCCYFLHNLNGRK